MLVLSRKTDERIVIGKDIVVTVLKITGNRVQLGFTAPDITPINRAEVPRDRPHQVTATA